MRAASAVALACACAGLLAASTLRAQPDDFARAHQLFENGRRLMQEPGKLDEACTLLTESYGLRKRGDTLLNLAECHRRQGKTTTAWREFDEAIRFAEEVAFPEAIAAAKGLRDELAVDLSVLTITLASEPAPPGLALTIDGEPLSNTWLGLPLRLDPGVHTVTATAEGHKPFAASATLGPKGDRVALKVTLEKLPPPPAPPKPPPPAPPPPEPEPVAADDEAPVWAWVTGGAGVALLGLSIGFGVDTKSAGDELDATCGDERLACPRDYDFAPVRAREERSFGLFVGLGVAGIGALGAGIAGVALGLDGGDGPEGVAVTPWASPEGAGLAVRARLP